MQIKPLQSITQIPAAEWNRLLDPGYPFLRHEFLSALEQSGAVCAQTGWQITHLAVSTQNEIMAVLPLYCKYHSRGEYVFDQQWADAYRDHELDYYPKLLTAVPFTPCQGQRLLIKPDCPWQPVLGILLDYIKQTAAVSGFSSWHCLFPDTLELDALRTQGLIIRQGVQFQWFNRDYRDFADFLQTLTATKRKMLKRERRIVAEQGIEMLRIGGAEISAAQWQVFFRFYIMTYAKKGSQAYLNLAFFQQIAASMPEQILMVMAVKNGAYIAAALFFIGADTLFGRYWGCEAEYQMLHFEACYYQGLEYCIEQGLRRFDSGAQGEHKISRGFEPITTYSAHWLKDKRFALAIADFVEREQQMLKVYKEDAASYLPFKQQTRD